MATKIQINSLQALERLIGGDTELEMEVRNSVAQNFSKKYLKGVIDEKIIKLIDKAVAEELGVVNWPFDIKGVAKKRVDEYVEKAVAEEFNKKLNIALTEKLSTIAKKLKELLKENLEEEVYDEMKEAVLRKLQEKIAEV